jgi:hypothetical protein
MISQNIWILFSIGVSLTITGLVLFLVYQKKAKDKDEEPLLLDNYQERVRAQRKIIDTYIRVSYSGIALMMLGICLMVSSLIWGLVTLQYSQ